MNERSDGGVRLALIGDLHDSWNDFDAAYLNASDYHGVLFLGDLGRGADTSDRIARSISRLSLPTLVMPGNADLPHAPALRAEFAMQRGRRDLFDDPPDAAQPEDDAFRGIRLCGYSLHRVRAEDAGFTIIAGRPFSMGGPELSFEHEIHQSFGLATLDESARRLCELVDAAETRDLVFVSHNGPLGLGDDPHDPWGCDFLPDRADWGDPDLAAVIEHATQRGRRVRAVIGGHMHHRVRGSETPRSWKRDEDGVLYLNPARVPRIESSRDGLRHYHVALTVRADDTEAEEIVVLE